MLVLRLSRVGKKHEPSFRVVVQEKSAAPQGKFIEKIGFYNPRQKEADLDEKRVTHWLDNGAKPSATVHNLLVDKGIIEEEKRQASTKLSGDEIDQEAEEEAESSEEESEEKEESEEEKQEEEDKETSDQKEKDKNKEEDKKEDKKEDKTTKKDDSDKKSEEKPEKDKEAEKDKKDKKAESEEKASKKK